MNVKTMRITEHMEIFKCVCKRNGRPKNKMTLNLRNTVAEMMGCSVN